jgi:hypothetical protein
MRALGPRFTHRGIAVSRRSGWFVFAHERSRESGRPDSVREGSQVSDVPVPIWNCPDATKWNGDTPLGEGGFTRAL